MTQVLEIPDLNIPAQELKMILAEALFSQGSVSLGKAAQIAGYSERTFSELLLKKWVSPVIFDEEHMEEDIRNAWHTEGDRWHLCVDRIWKAGASSSFMFALSYISGTTILVDDLKARKTAKKLGCRIMVPSEFCTECSVRGWSQVPMRKWAN